MNSLIRSKRGTGAIGGIFLFLVFVVIWFVWLAGWLNEVGEGIVTQNNLGGIEAFFFMNLNLTIFICMILGIMWFMYSGAVQ